MTALLLLLFVFIPLVSGQNKTCGFPPNRGQDGPDKGIRWFYNETLGECLAFMYRGAGANNYASWTSCYYGCHPKTDMCNGGVPSSGRCTRTEKCANPKDTCRWISDTEGICCDAKVDVEYNVEYFPKCDYGSVVFRESTNGFHHALLGRSCDDGFCPSNTSCHQGKYLAHCCTRCGFRPTVIERGPTRQIRWFYDQRLGECLPYSGAPQSHIPTFFDCYFACRPMDLVQCAGGKSNGTCNALTQYKCPNPTDPCLNTGFRFGICCDEKTQGEYEAEKNPKCAKGQLVLSGDRDAAFTAWLGHSCSDHFCPENSVCHQGKWLSYCCEGE